MKKFVVAIIATMFIAFGVAVTTVSAKEYEVKKGDNLWDIAQEYETTVEAIVEINELPTTVIQPKQLLLIHEIYIVEEEDTLRSIAKEFDVKVKDIQEWNDLFSNDLEEGQELEIRGLYDNKEKEVEAKTEASKAKKAPAKKETKTDGKTFSVTATAYTAECAGCSGITYTGVDLNADRHAKVIAVDPNVIPLGSKVYVEGYGEAIAADIGGAIKGNKIDLHVPTKQDAYSWGVRTVNITVLD